MKKIAFVLCVVLISVTLGWASGMKKKKLPPYEYGSVTISNYSQQGGMQPVLFDHWLHRQYATCRLCHVDIGFGMTAGSTKIVQHLGRFKIRQNLHTACKAVRTDNPAYFKELHGGIIR